jgi:hypothetical protein
LIFKRKNVIIEIKKSVMIKKLALLVVAILFSTFSYSQNIINSVVTQLPDTAQSRQDKILDSLFINKVEISFTFKAVSKMQIDTFLTNIISVDGFNGSTMIVRAYANKEEFREFLKLKLKYNIIEKDPFKVLTMATTTDQMATWDRYPTYGVYDQMMTDFQTNYPNLFKRFDLVTLASGHKLIMGKITSNVNTAAPKPHFLYSSSIHGDEITGFVMMLHLIDYLLSNYGTNSRITNLLNTVELWVLPDANPDGTYRGGDNNIAGAIRGNFNAIDMNRNFPGTDGVVHPNNYDYQIETKSMLSYADSLNFVVAGNFHGGSDCVNYPWDRWVWSVHKSPDDTWWQYVSKNFSDSTRANAVTTIKEGGATNTYFNRTWGTVAPSNAWKGYSEGGDWYVINGGRQDFMNMYMHCREVTIEISMVKETSSDSLPAYWNALRDPLIKYIEECRNGFNGIITDACTNLPLKAKVFVNSHDADSSWVWSNATFGDYYRPINAGTWSVTFSAPGYTSQTMNITTIDGAAVIQNVALSPVVVSPSANYTASPTTVNSGSTIVTFTNTSTNSVAYYWDFGDGTSSTLANPTHIFSNTGTYTVNLTASQGCNSNTMTRTSYITVTLPSGPTTTGGSSCGGAVSLSASAGSGWLNWYAANNSYTVINTGASYTTPSLNSTTNYYVENWVPGTTQTVGEPNSTGSVKITSAQVATYVTFDVAQPTRIVSVDVYTSAVDSVTIMLFNSSGALMMYKKQILTYSSLPTLNTITLNFDVPAGTGYRMSTDMGQSIKLYYKTGVTYPYNSSPTSGLVTLTAGSPTANTYYFLYNWQTQPCTVSARSLVTATILPAPVITSQPTSPPAACNGAGAPTFTVAVTGSSLTYKWQEYIASWADLSDGSYYSGTGTTTLTITNPTSAMSGRKYRCNISNGSCGATSLAGTLTVNAAPSITGQPANSSIAEAASTTFTVTASGVGLTYQWQVNTGSGWNNITTAGSDPIYANWTAATLNVNNVVIGNSGYKYRCIVTGTCSPAATSDGVATLTVTAGVYRYSVATGNWATTTTWAATSGGTAGASAPVAGNIVVIEGNKTVTVAANAACAKVSIASGSTLAISSAASRSLTLTGDISGAGVISSSTNSSFTSTINIGGNWNFTGTFLNARLAVSPNGTTDQTMGASSTMTCMTFILNKASGRFLPNSRTLTIGTTFTLTAGTIVCDAATWAGNYSMSPSAPAAGVTVEYTNANPTILGGINWQNLKFSGTGTAGASAALTIQGDLTNTGGGTLNFGANNVTLSGTVAANSITGFTTTGTVSMTKTSGAATLTGNVNGGPLTINGTGGTLNLGTGLTHTFTGLVTLTAGTMNGGTSTIKANLVAAPAWTNTAGVYTASSGTVNFGGGGAQSITGTLATTFNNLIVSGSGTKTLTKLPFVTGILSLEGTASVSTAPSYGSIATLQYKGSGAQSTGVELPASFPSSGGIIIANTSGSAVTLSSATVLRGPLTINTSAKFDISKTTSLTVGGATSNAGTFTIKADASSVGSFIDNGTITGTGTFNVEKYMTGAGGATPNGRFWYIASPVASATSNVINAAGTDKLWYYTEGSPGSYTEITNNSTALNIGEGYSARLGAASGTYTFTGGAFNKGQIDITGLTRTGTTYVQRGFHLIGNPYPSHVSWDLATKTNIGTTIWYRTVSTGGSMVFDTYNSTGGIGTNNNGFGTVTGILGPMQSVWVRASTDNVSGSITFDLGMRTHTSSVSMKKENQNNILRLKIANGSNMDETVIYFNSSADNNFDTFDSEKMFATDDSIPQIYSTTSDNTEVAINGQNELLPNVERIVPLGFSTSVQGTYTLQATNLDVFDPSVTVYLEDLLTGNFIDLRSNNFYSFSSVVVNDTNRFKLHFNGVITEIPKDDINNSIVYSANGNIYISTTLDNSYVEIYNILGEKLLQTNIEKGLSKLQYNFSQGAYIVTFSNAETIITKKVIVN